MSKKYDLVGVDGNAFSIMGYVTKAMKKEGKSQEEIKEYSKKAMLRDYCNLLCLSMEIVDELNKEKQE